MASMISIMVLVMAVTLSSQAISGAETASCADKLVPCAAYMNSTDPPASCCTPLKQAVEQELTCLCNLYNTPGLLQSFGINVTQALQLPAYCKINGDLSACSKISASTPTNASVTPPPAASAGVRIGNNNRLGRRMVQHEMIFSSLFFFLIIWGYALGMI